MTRRFTGFIIVAVLHDALEAREDLHAHRPLLRQWRQAIEHGINSHRGRKRIADMMNAYVRTLELQNPTHSIAGDAVETARLICDAIESPGPVLMPCQAGAARVR